MALTTLPPELMLHLATYLNPDSVLYLALTCKDYHKLYKSALLEHSRLSLKYRVIDAAPTGYAAEGEDKYLIWSTMKAILEDPRKGWYVRELNLPATRQYHWDFDNQGLIPDNMLATPPEEDQAIYKEAARALEDLYPEGLGTDFGTTNPAPRQTWPDLMALFDDRISSGYDDAIIAILVHHLPHLKTIRITDIETDALEFMLQWIAMTYKDPARAPKLPFQHLQNASISHWDTEMSCSPDWACFFLSIPSLRGFVAHAMGGAPTIIGTEAYLPEGALPCSNVTELWLDRCVLDTTGLETILDGIKNLKRLRYTDGGATVSDSEFYEPKRIIRAVANSTGESLEFLLLDQDGYGYYSDSDVDLTSISLRDFEKLRTLRCQWHMLLPEEAVADVDEPLETGFYGETEPPIDSFDIRNILPESLQELQLRGVFDDGDWDQLTEVFSIENAATPNLTNVRIERKSRGEWPIRTLAVCGDAPAPSGNGHSHPLAKLLRGHGPT